ncbi:hypothetical protein HK096_002305 [Nowakowskiella sp. JEL0078]|nr:hypothetical protein HK096_002305 [Nowakowskiella sp. JEL0078]
MSNPFTIDDSDPFADPSISHALSSDTVITDDILAQSATLQQKPQRPSSYPPKPRNDDALTAKEAELRRREEELAEREAAVSEQQEQMRKQGYKPPNWPPFYSYIYHNIDEEIPVGEAQRTMCLTYKYWLATVALLFFNMIACLTMMVSHPANMNSEASDFGVSFVYMAAGVFSAYMAVGIPGSGAAGFINFLGTSTAGSAVAGVFTGIAFLGWVA